MSLGSTPEYAGVRMNAVAKPESIAGLLIRRAEKTPDALAFQFPRSEAGWTRLSWNEALARIRSISSGLHALGLEPEQRCAILSSTRIEWVFADLAVMCAGGATTTIYPTSPAKDCEFILKDSQSVIAFAEDIEQLAKLRLRRDQLPNLKKVVLFDAADELEEDSWVITLPELEQLGKSRRSEQPDEFERVAHSIERDRLATLIYTSGTTGQPKGVELTHDCWLYQGEAAAALDLLRPDDHQYLWLPLSHSFGKLMLICPLSVGFATTVDGRIPKLVQNLAEVQPTFMGAPPRIFEKIYNKIVMNAEQAGGAKAAIFSWALVTGLRVSRLRQRRQEPHGLLRLKYLLADKLVFSKVRKRFGGRIRFMLSGGAPLSREMAEFFHAAGILILEGYGLTECAAGGILNRLDTFAFGTVGLPFEGMKLKLEADGEILLHSRGLMRGYHNLPRATRETLTEDGWLRTGDIGELDANGNLKITDRKKDLIKTSGGKYVAPQKIEALLKGACPYIGHVLVHGDTRPFCTALVSLDAEAMAGWGAGNGANAAVYSDLVGRPEVKAMVQSAVDSMNEALAPHESIKDFAILPEEINIESGLLTPSMKVRRRLVEAQFAAELDSLYRGVLAASPAP